MVGFLSDQSYIWKVYDTQGRDIKSELFSFSQPILFLDSFFPEVSLSTDSEQLQFTEYTGILIDQK